jgi:hypothetical protein
VLLALQRTRYERCGDDDVHLSGLFCKQFLQPGCTLSSAAASADLKHFCMCTAVLMGSRKNKYYAALQPTISAAMNSGLISLASAHGHELA